MLTRTIKEFKNFNNAMLYDGITIYTSHEDKYFTESKPNNSIAYIILHTGSDEALFRMLNVVKNKRLTGSIYVLITNQSDFDRNIVDSYSSINWIFFNKPKDRICMVMFAGHEASENYVTVLDTSYDLIRFDEDEIMDIFKSDDKAVCISPFVYSNADALFPTCYAPKITDNVRVDVISVVPEEEFINALYPFMLLGVYKKKTFVIGGDIDYKIENLDIRAYDYFARLWLMGYHTYIHSSFKIRSNIEFMPIIDRSFNRDNKILSSKLLSFYKNRGGNAGLRPFWWVNYNIINVIKDVKPFLKKATVDFYTLVKIWTVELGEVDDLL